MTITSYNTATNAFKVISHGKGWAYEIIRLTDNESRWFQDDDATQIQEYTNDFDNESLINDYF